MVQDKFNKEKFINYWVESSDEDFKTMNTLFDNKRYNWSLLLDILLLKNYLKLTS